MAKAPLVNVFTYIKNLMKEVAADLFVEWTSIADELE